MVDFFSIFEGERGLGGLSQTIIYYNCGYLFQESRMTTSAMVLSIRSSKANTNVSNIAGYLLLP